MTKTIMRLTCFAVHLLLLAIGVGAVQAATTRPLQMTVVDAQTGAPLAGVTLVYQLEATEGTWTGHGGAHAYVVVDEAVSDANGRISIPAHRFNTSPFGWLSRPQWSYPQIFIFKSGYAPQGAGGIFWSNGKGMPDLDDVLAWPQRPLPVKLNRAENDTKYADSLRDFGSTVSRAWSYATRTEDACAWTKVPRIIIAIEDEIMRLEPRVSKGAVSTPFRDLLANERNYEVKCGLPSAFFAAFAPGCPDSPERMTNVERVANGRCGAVTKGYCEKTGQWWINQWGKGWRNDQGALQEPIRCHL
jgi:hypothetical protein